MMRKDSPLLAFYYDRLPSKKEGGVTTATSLNYHNSLPKVKNGGQGCPEGYINIDGECIKKNSWEYQKMLNEGLVGTMEGDRFWGNKATLQPVTVVSSRDKDTQAFYDKLKGGDLDEYNALVNLGLMYGFPHVSLKEKAGAFDFLDPNAFNTEEQNNRGYYRANYSPIQQRIYLGSNLDREDLRNDYIAELAHHKQLMDKGSLDFSLRGLKRLGHVLANSVKNLEFPMDVYDREYKTPGSLEYEAHRKIEPRLKYKYEDLLDKQAEEDMYYESPGYFQKYKPTQTYKRGGEYFPEYHSYAPPRMDNGGEYPCAEGETWSEELQKCIKVAATIKHGNETRYYHEPGTGGLNYQSVRTISPYTKNRDIKRYTPVPTSGQDVDFITNYRNFKSYFDPGHVGYNFNPTSVPYEGEKHWNINRFIIDPHLGNAFDDLRASESSMEEKRASILSDMYKYFMLQNPGHKGKSFRQAKRFVRREIDPIMKGAFLNNLYASKKLAPNFNLIDPLNTFDEENPLISTNVFNRGIDENESIKKLVGDQYHREDWTPDKLKDISMDYLRNYKKMSKRDAKKQWKKWEDDAAAYEGNYKYDMSNPRPIRQKVASPKEWANLSDEERFYREQDLPEVGEVGWNVEYFDPITKKTETKHFTTNKEAEQFYNDPKNKVSLKYSDVSSYMHKNGGDISIPDLQESRWLYKYGPGGQTTDGCPPYFTKNAKGECVPNFSNFQMPANYSTDKEQVMQPMYKNLQVNESLNQSSTGFNYNDYYNKANKYLSRPIFKGTELKPEHIAKSAQEFYKKTGYEYPLDLLLTQAQLETGLGTKLKSKYNYFNVGNTDSGSIKNYQNPEESLLDYMGLIYNDYLQKGKRNVNDLLKPNGFVNYAGNRYALAPDYEKKLLSQKNFIAKNLSLKEGGLTRYGTGGTKLNTQSCPEGYIRVNSICIPINSDEYREAYNKGLVGEPQSGSDPNYFTSDSMFAQPDTLSEVKVYGKALTPEERQKKLNEHYQQQMIDLGNKQKEWGQFSDDSNTGLIRQQRIKEQHYTDAWNRTKAEVEEFKKSNPWASNLSDNDIVEKIMMRNEILRLRQESPDILRESGPGRSAFSKAWAIASNPMTALKYKLDGQDIPDYFDKGEKNNLDFALNILNPATYINSAVSVGEAATSPLKTAKTLTKAGINLATNLVDNTNVYNDASNAEALGLLGDVGNMFIAGQAGAFKPLTRAINTSKETGLLSNAWKLNPNAGKIPFVEGKPNWLKGWSKDYSDPTKIDFSGMSKFTESIKGTREAKQFEKLNNWWANLPVEKRLDKALGQYYNDQSRKLIAQAQLKKTGLSKLFDVNDMYRPGTYADFVAPFKNNPNIVFKYGKEPFIGQTEEMVLNNQVFNLADESVGLPFHSQNVGNRVVSLMPKVSGKGSSFGITNIPKYEIPREAAAEMASKLRKLQKLGIYPDWKGNNFMFNPETNKLSVFDLNMAPGENSAFAQRFASGTNKMGENPASIMKQYWNLSAKPPRKINLGNIPEEMGGYEGPSSAMTAEEYAESLKNNPPSGQPQRRFTSYDAPNDTYTRMKSLLEYGRPQVPDKLDFVTNEQLVNDKIFHSEYNKVLKDFMNMGYGAEEATEKAVKKTLDILKNHPDYDFDLGLKSSVERLIRGADTYNPFSKNFRDQFLLSQKPLGSQAKMTLRNSLGMVDDNFDITKKAINVLGDKTPGFDEASSVIKNSIKHYEDLLKVADDPKQIEDIQNRIINLYKKIPNTFQGKPYTGVEAFNQIKPNKYGGSIDQYKPGGETTDGCPPGFNKNAFGICVNASGQTPDQAYASKGTISSIANSTTKSTAVPFKTRNQQIKEATDRAVRENYNLGEFSKQSSVGPAPFQTIDQQLINQQKKQQYVQNRPNTEINDNGDIVTKNPDRGFEGQPLTPNAKRFDKGLSHIMNAIEATSALAGAGQIGSNLLRLGASGLEKGFGRNIISKGLKNFTSSINPTLNAIDEAGAYIQMDPIGIMGNRLNSKLYNPTTALNTANNTITGVEKNLTNSAIEGIDLVAGQNNLANIVDANRSAGKFISSEPQILGVQHGMDALAPGYNAHLRGKGRYVPPATGDMAPYISYEPPEYSDAEKIWRSWFKNEPPPYNPRPGFGPQSLTSSSSQGLFGKLSDKFYNIRYKKQIADLESQLNKSLKNLNTPEGRKRLADLGINPEEVFSNPPSITSNPARGSEYSPNRNAINVNMRDAKRLKATPQQIIEHELGHNIQDASRASGQNSMTDIDHNAQLIDLKEPQTLSDLEAMTHLQKEQYAGAKLEGMPYLREMRQDMLEKGFIKNQYDEVDPAIMENYLNSNSGQRFKKLIDTSSTNYRIVPLLLNRLPVVAGAVAGAAALDKQKLGGKINQYEPGGETTDDDKPKKTILKNRRIGETFEPVSFFNSRPIYSPDTYITENIYDPTCTDPDGLGCSYQATRNAMNITHLPLQSYAPANAGYRDAVAEREGLQNIFNQEGKQKTWAESGNAGWKYPTVEDFKKWKAGDIVVLDAAGVDYFPYNAPPGFTEKDNSGASHNGVVVGFTEEGFPIIKHGYATGKNKGRVITEVLGKGLGKDERNNTVYRNWNDSRVSSLGHGRYAVKSVWRPKEIKDNDLIESIKYINETGEERAARKEATDYPAVFGLNRTYEEQLQSEAPVAAAFSGATARLNTKKALVNLFNDKELDKEIQYQLGLDSKTLQNFKPVIFGIAGQESTFDDVDSIKASAKDIPGNLANLSNSKGLFQIKYDSLTDDERSILGIKSPNDLLDTKTAYKAALLMMSHAKNRMDLEVEQGTHPGLKKADPYFRAAYYYNSPARAISTAKEWGKGRSPFVVYDPETWLNPFFDRDQKIPSGSIDPNYANKIELRMDEGSYPDKVMKLAKDLFMDNTTTETTPETMEPVVVRSLKNKNKKVRYYND